VHDAIKVLYILLKNGFFVLQYPFFMANPVKIRGNVASLTKHDENVFTVSIMPERRIPRFNAGQFLHLALDDYDPQGGFWPESRVFSIASAPTSQQIEIVYSVKGRYTARMRNELAISKQVWLKLPYGEFSIDTAAAAGQDIVLVAGGTGISPFLSYLRIMLNGSPNTRKIHLLYGIRNAAHLLCPGVLSACCSTIKGFGMDLYVEKGVDSVFPRISQHQGMIQIERIFEIGKTMADPAYFLSGPPMMIQTFKKGLATDGINGKNIKVDEWE
jgi:ferredoxin-NADP reductase